MIDHVQRQLLAISFMGLTSNLLMRCFDPMLPQISAEMSVSVVTAASLGTAFAIPFAFMQPLLGAVGDMFGKARLIVVSSVLLVAASVVGIFADSFSVLVVSRIIAGAAAGGIIPSSLALVGDLVRVELRQVALARFLGAALTGNLLGTLIAGAVADHFNWRVALTVLVLLLAASVVTGFFALRSRIAEKGTGFDIGAARRSYATILGNRNSYVCFSAVFIEGALIFGLFPYIAPLFTGGRLTEAGLIIAAFPLGGIAYSLSLPWLMKRLKRAQMIVLGTCIVAVQLVIVSFVPPWPVQCLAFLALGIGFYQLHSLIQLAVTELAPSARGSAMALHAACYFIGMGMGPIFYGFGFFTFGIFPTMAISAVLMVLLGVFCSRTMRIGSAPV